MRITQLSHELAAQQRSSPQDHQTIRTPGSFMKLFHLSDDFYSNQKLLSSPDLASEVQQYRRRIN